MNVIYIGAVTNTTIVYYNMCVAVYTLVSITLCKLLYG